MKYYFDFCPVRERYDQLTSAERIHAFFNDCPLRDCFYFPVRVDNDFCPVRFSNDCCPAIAIGLIGGRDRELIPGQGNRAGTVLTRGALHGVLVKTGVILHGAFGTRQGRSQRARRKQLDLLPGRSPARARLRRGLSGLDDQLGFCGGSGGGVRFGCGARRRAGRRQRNDTGCADQYLFHLAGTGFSALMAARGGIFAAGPLLPSPPHLAAGRRNCGFSYTAIMRAPFMLLIPLKNDAIARIFGCAVWRRPRRPAGGRDRAATRTMKFEQTPFWKIHCFFCVRVK